MRNEYHTNSSANHVLLFSHHPNIDKCGERVTSAQAGEGTNSFEGSLLVRGQIQILSTEECFQTNNSQIRFRHVLQDGYLSPKPHVDGEPFSFGKCLCGAESTQFIKNDT